MMGMVLTLILSRMVGTYYRHHFPILTGCDYIPDLMNTPPDITIEYFTSFKITTKNAAVWALHLTEVPHLWIFIFVYWHRRVAHFFSKNLLDVSI
jgi:hypothetical protein